MRTTASFLAWKCLTPYHTFSKSHRYYFNRKWSLKYRWIQKVRYNTCREHICYTLSKTSLKTFANDNLKSVSTETPPAEPLPPSPESQGSQAQLPASDTHLQEAASVADTVALHNTDSFAQVEKEMQLLRLRHYLLPGLPCTFILRVQQKLKVLPGYRPQGQHYNH